MRLQYQDVIIIGSGFGACPPAMRLAKEGLKVTILEKGPGLDPYKDFRQTQDPKYLLKYLKLIPGKHVKLNFIEAEGGGSGFYAHVSLRAPNLIFNLKDSDGLALWPGGLTRQKLDPYYEIGERILRVHQIEPGRVPKSGQVFALMMNKLGHTVDRSRYAESGCLNCGYCITGCIYSAKQSLLLNYLPAAKRYGAQLLADTEAIYVKKGDSPGYPYTVIAKQGDELLKLHARIVILAAGTAGTAKLLLKSKAYLPYLSDQVGKNVSFNGSIKQLCVIPDWCPDGDMFTGRINPGMLSYDFMRSDHFLITLGKAMPIQLLGSVRIYTPESAQTYWGTSHVEFMKKLRRRILILVAQGLTKPNCRFVLNAEDKLEFKVGSVVEIKDFKRKGLKILDGIIRKSGAVAVDKAYIGTSGVPLSNPHFSSSHPLGSCRMAETPQKGVIRSDGQVFGYPGLYITDGSAIPSGLIVNPSLTILANAERITHGICNR